VVERHSRILDFVLKIKKPTFRWASEFGKTPVLPNQEAKDRQQIQLFLRLMSVARFIVSDYN